MDMLLLIVIILLLGYANATVGDMKQIIKSMQFHLKKINEICDNIINKKDKGGK